MDVSIIIVNYNTRDITKHCIDSIITHTNSISYEIILVDNSSTDGSKDIFAKDPRIKYIFSNKNLGFGKANNLGFQHSSGKYIFLLNSDTLLKNNAILHFFKSMEMADNSIACIGCVLAGSNGKPTKSFGPFLSPKLLFPKRIKQYVEGPIPDEGIIVPVVIGADLFIRRKVIDLLGFFDPVFFMYHEENDLQRRFFINGYISKIIRGPRIIHLEGKSNKFKINTLMIEGAYTYMKKWLPFFQYILFRILYSLTRSVKILVIKSSFKEKLRFLKILYFYRAQTSTFDHSKTGNYNIFHNS